MATLPAIIRTAGAAGAVVENGRWLREERSMVISLPALEPLRERAGVDKNERSQRGPRTCAAMTKSVGSKVRKHLRCAVEHISWSRPN